MSPRVTVATRTKNRPLLLARALDSIRSQTMADFELVIVNDAGELAPVEALVAERLADAPFPVRILDNAASSGREAAMNDGFAGSAADYLVLHDDDDAWAPQFLERTVAHLDSHPEQGAVAVRTEVVFERIEGDAVIEESREILAADLHDVTLADMLSANFAPPISLLFRRERYESAGPFDGRLPVLADWDFTLRLLAERPIGFLDGEPLAFWHQRRTAEGDLGNSVVVAADEHAAIDRAIRDERLRAELADGGTGLGELLYLADRFRGLEASLAEGRGSTAAAQAAIVGARVELEQAIGRLEGRQIETQIALARIEQIVRAGGPLQRRLADGARGVGGRLAGALRPLGERGADRAKAAASSAGERARSLAERARARGVEPVEPAAAVEPAAQAGAEAQVAAGSLARDVVRAEAPATPRTPRGDARFPEGGRRAIIYLLFDPSGRADDYVLVKLAALREHAERIVVISNGPVEAASRAQLEEIVDDVWERENTGFDVWAYKEAQERIGWDELVRFDELILMNYTFFGPIYPFSETFDRLDVADVDFWGLTEHGAVTEHEFAGGGALPPHIQSHWIAVRGPMLRSPEYRTYWDEMPEITSYDASISLHETRFTRHFDELGFSHLVAWPESDYPSQHPIFDDIAQMLDDRLPIVKRRLFFHDPLYLEKNVIIGRDVLERIEGAGYPLELIWRNIVRSAQPRMLATNTNLLDILPVAEFEPDTGRALDRGAMPRIAVVMHLFYDEMLDEMMDRVDLVPGDPRLIITTSDEERAGRIRDGLAARGGWGERAEVRVVASNRGRDISAFYVACADVLHDESIDLIVKIHGKKSAQDGWNAGQWFKRHLLDNLLPSEGYAANLIALFQRDATLGLVFPPVVNMGYPTLGHGWFTNKEPAKALAKRLGVTVPLDAATPLAPLGSMFVARREALAILADAGFGWDDFPGEGGYKDGTLAHVIERFPAYAAAQLGYRTGTVMSPEMAAISHGFLEYRLQAIHHELPGTTTEELIRMVQTPGIGAVALQGMKWMSRRLPVVGKVMWPAYRGVVLGAKGARSAVRRLR